MRRVTYQEALSLAAENNVSADSPLVSFIVPVFNAPADKLKRCIDSLTGQTYENIEILIIDDGSEKECADSIAALEALDSRIRVIQGDHRGASNTRNFGMCSIRGEWLAFADADDEYSTVFAEEAVMVAQALNCDLVCGSVVALFAGDEKEPVAGDFTCYVTSPKNNTEEISGLAWQMLGHHRYLKLDGPEFRGRGPAAKLYKTTVLGSLRFDGAIAIGEDTLFNYRFIERCGSVAIVDQPWYWYYQYQGSSVRSSELNAWTASIDGILAARQEEESITPFALRCAYLVLLGIQSFMAVEDRKVARNDSIALMRFAHGLGCFSQDGFEDFQLSVWVRTMFKLCAAERYSLAYRYWVIKTEVATIVKKRELIDTD